MDAINQAVASAKTALGYGDATATTATNQTAGREPISGEQGAGTATEPYDKGNETTATTTTYTGSSQDTSSYQPSTTTTTTDTSDTTALPSHIKSNPSESNTNIPSSSSNPTTMSSSTPSQPGMNTSGNITSDTQAAGTTSSAATNIPMSTGAPAGQSRPSAGERPGDVRPTEANENRSGSNVGGFGTVEPSVNADPKSAQQPKTAQEGSDRPLEEPDNKETAAIKSDKAEVEGEQKGQSQGGHHPISDEEREKLAAKGELPHDPNDHSGEPMHMHGGGSDDPKQEEKSEGGVTEKQRKDSIGQEGGDPHGSAKGTGEEYVKSSGLAADGGDFDAAKPGAGREATRLMEEKGMKKDGGPATSGGSAVGHDSSSDSKDGKPSMMQKIKDKMNPGTGSGLD